MRTLPRPPRPTSPTTAGILHAATPLSSSAATALLSSYDAIALQ
ncbi:hypothetical protein PR003_g27976 [Phytophthora rubi]|uniref:Uncharacterized protein n=1 Tax=Phytophthora rubi TaxID=129364 RepID=A0A6A4C2L8_9STRA|nr:hypothetical protein PR003_g27976 [Phytophthora rubi]